MSDSDKYNFLSVSYVYLSTEMHDGFGIVFLEYMQCGLPIICYNKGGQADFLKDGINGFLINLGDKNCFKDRMLQLANDKALRETISSTNKSYVKTFNISNVADQYIKLFEQVLSERKS